MSNNILNQLRDESNAVVLGLTDTSYVDHWVTAGADTTTWNWPDGYSICKFGTTEIFYLKQNGTAAVPSADVVNGTGSRKSPAFIRKGEEDSFSLAVDAACAITMEFYK